ncbi:uncharacterized protein DS421_17g574950 [Arachis hypogaea]|nr:uncharacterized protein DS421_17g574950 [Arachis hypogaea]
MAQRRERKHAKVEGIEEVGEIAKLSSLTSSHSNGYNFSYRETLEKLEFEGGMEPSPSMQYNLRSRGRIIGNRLLRQRRQSRLRFMEKYRPYPFVAMQHYNRMLKEEEQYKVYDRGDGIMSAYKKVGVFHQLHILGVPKSFEYMQNSLDDDVPVKHFYARIHQAPKRNTHVDYCLDITRVVPLCCKFCGLANGRAIKSRSLELSEQAKANGEDSDSDYSDGYLDPDPPKKEIRGALAESRRRR